MLFERFLQIRLWQRPDLRIRGSNRRGSVVQQRPPPGEAQPAAVAAIIAGGGLLFDIFAHRKIENTHVLKKHKT